MTQKEFEIRAMEVTSKEFESINMVYMYSDLDKDEFCKMWCKMNYKRVKAYKEAKRKAEMDADNKSKVFDIYQNLYTGLTYDQKFSLMATQVLKKDEKAFLDSIGIKTEDILTSDMMYNMLIFAGI